jgi:hypothetical protein
VIGFRFSELNSEKIPDMVRVVDWMRPTVQACMMMMKKILTPVWYRNPFVQNIITLFIKLSEFVLPAHSPENFNKAGI